MENCLKGSHDELGHLDLVTALGMDCGIPPPLSQPGQGGGDVQVVSDAVVMFGHWGWSVCLKLLAW